MSFPGKETVNIDGTGKLPMVDRLSGWALYNNTVFTINRALKNIVTYSPKAS
jgi:hypothetical protein